MGTDLVADASWGGTAPGSGDVATWVATSLGSGLSLGSPVSWSGISVADALTDIDITGAGSLTLGSDGIDLSGSARNLSLGIPVSLGSDQAWRVASGRLLTLTGALSGAGGFTNVGPGATILNSASQGKYPYAGAATVASGTLVLKRIPLAAPPTGAVLWLDGSDTATLFKDADGTQPATSSGDAVARWNDKSGYGNHALLSGTQTAPTLQTAVINGLSCVAFSSNTNCGMTTSLVISNGNFSVFLAASYGSTNVVFRRAIQGSNNWLIGPYNNQWQFFNGGFYGGVPSVLNRFFLLDVVGNATQSAYVDGTFRASRTGSYPGKIYLGSVTPAGGPPYPEPLEGNIAEVLIYNTALSAEDRVAVESYLQNKWQLPIPPPADSPLSAAVPVALGSGAVLDLTNLTTCTFSSLAGTSNSLVQFGNAALTLSNSAAVTFGGNLYGSGAFTKTGAGTLVLSGAASCSGAANVNGGTLQLDTGGSITGTGPFGIAASAGQTGTVSIAGGAFTNQLTGWLHTLGSLGTAVWNQTGGTARFSAQLNVADLPGSRASLSFSGGSFTCGTYGTLGFILGTHGSATMNLGGTAVFQAPQTMFGYYADGSGTLNMSGGTFTATSAYYSSIGLAGTGAWNQTGGTATFANQLNIANSPATSSSMTISGGSLTVVAGVFYVGVSGNGTLSIGGGPGVAAVSCPTMDLGLNATGSGVLNLLTNGLLTVGAGGLIKGSGTATLNLGGGTLTSAVGTLWSSPLNATLTGNGGPLHFAPASAKAITWSGSLSGSGGLVLDGEVLYLDGTNSYSGATVANAGYLVARSAGALGNTPSVTVFGGATFQLEGGVTLANTSAITIAGTGPDGRGAICGWSGTNVMSNPVALEGNSTIAAQAGTLTLNGVIGGSSALTIGHTGNGAATVIFAQPVPNTYEGDTTIAAGTLTLGANEVIPNGPGKGNVTVSSTLNLNNRTETVNGLSGYGVISGGGTLAVGDNDATSTFGGTLSSTLALTKTGSGTLTLTGVNTSSGLTTVSQGTLLVNGSNACPITASGGMLGGTGTIGGLVTINSGGHLAPGSSTGTLTLTGGLTLNDDAVLDVVTGNTSNLLRVAGGTFQGSGTGRTLVRVTFSGPQRGGTFVLVDWHGATPTGVDLTDFILELPPAYDSRATLSIVDSRLILTLYRGSVLRVR